MIGVISSWIMITSQNNTIKSMKHATIVSGRRNETNLSSDENRFAHSFYHSFSCLFYKFCHLKKKSYTKRFCFLLAFMLTWFHQRKIAVRFFFLYFFLFLTRNNCCDFFEFDDVILQSGHQSYFKTPLWCFSIILCFILMKK